MIFFGFYGLFLGVTMANLNWVNEVTAIKQSANVVIYLFSSWIIIALVAVPAFVFGEFISIKLYILLACCLLLIISFALYFWMEKYGVKKFESL